MDTFDLLDDGLPGRDQYTDITEVGHGRFSEVYRAREKAGGGTVALKHMTLSDPGELPTHVRRELAALEAVRHPNVVALLGTHQKGMAVALVLEYCMSDLRRVLELLGEGSPLDPALAKAVMQQLLQGIGVCHKAGFMHRDVSPSNVLIAEGSGLVKLGDFGQARPFLQQQQPGTEEDDGHHHQQQGQPPAGHLTHIVGTRWYKAPELLFGSRSYTPAVDLWSAGCVFAEMLTGRPLFPGTGDIDQICRLNTVLGSIDEAAWPGVRELPDWGKLLFPQNPGTGLAAALPSVPPAAVELLLSLLQYNPERRPTAAEALAAPYFSEAPAAAPPQALATLASALLQREQEHRHNRRQQQEPEILDEFDELLPPPPFAVDQLPGLAAGPTL